MRAVILAGGKGRRLFPYTISFPKPLVPVGDMPVLEIIIRQLKAAGFDHVTLAVGHLAELLEAYFGDGSKWGLRIDYSREDKPLGTVGPLSQIKDLPETFLVMNGDVLTTLDYGKLFQYHLDESSILTIACHRCNNQIDLGVIEFNGRFEVTNYREKPVIPYDASMGVYVFSRKVLDHFEKDTYVDFPTAVCQLVSEKQPVKVHLTACRWLDIGRQEDYAAAQESFESLRHEFLPDEPASATNTDGEAEQISVESVL